MGRFIFIPVVNNFGLLRKAVRSVKPHLFDECIVFNNSGGDLPESICAGTPFTIWNPERRMTFMETQNIFRAYAVGGDFDHYAFMHNDGEVVDDTDVRLVEEATSLEQDWGVIFTNYDVLCMLSTRAVREIGQWGDPQWPSRQQSGYFLDCDYYRRLRLGGYAEFTLKNSNVTHARSNTLDDPEEWEVWDQLRETVLGHYVRKWGGPPHSETVNSNDGVFPDER